MYEKNFHSATTGNERSLIISATGEGNVILAIQADVSRGIQLDQATMPAIMLALAEAAGVKPVDHTVTGLGKPNWLEGIAHGLKLHIEHEAKRTAEAREQAELEAEALKLWLACRAVSNKYQTEDIKFSDLDATEQAEWLAVARKAREMSAEK